MCRKDLNRRILKCIKQISIVTSREINKFAKNAFRYLQEFQIYDSVDTLKQMKEKLGNKKKLENNSPVQYTVSCKKH